MGSLQGSGVKAATGMYLTNIIYTVVQVPLQAVVNTPFGAVALTFTSLLFWCVAIEKPDYRGGFGD